jgi:hypothetical protein
LIIHVISFHITASFYFICIQQCLRISGHQPGVPLLQALQINPFFTILTLSSYHLQVNSVLVIHLKFLGVFIIIIQQLKQNYSLSFPQADVMQVETMGKSNLDD